MADDFNYKIGKEMLNTLDEVDKQLTNKMLKTVLKAVPNWRKIFKLCVNFLLSFKAP